MIQRGADDSMDSFLKVAVFQEGLQTSKKTQLIEISFSCLLSKQFLKSLSSKTPRFFTKDLRWEDRVPQPERKLTGLHVVPNKIASASSSFKTSSFSSQDFWAPTDLLVRLDFLASEFNIASESYDTVL